MNEHVVELVNGELDGTNSPGESTELAQILERDDSAKAFFDETRALFGALGSVQDVEPPAELKGRIMESISRQSAAVPAQSQGFLGSLKDLFEPVLARPGWAVSYAFAAGLLIGVAALSVATDSTDPGTNVVQGTMGSVSNVIDDATIEVGQVTVNLSTIDFGHEVVLDLTVVGSASATIQIEKTGGSAAPATITTSGSGHFVVSVGTEPSSLVVTVNSSGEKAQVSLVASNS